MATTYEKIATTTLGSAQSSITFSSIPATYTDLKLVLVGLTSATTNLALRFNSDTGTNYSETGIFANGSSITNVRYTNASIIYLDTGWGSPDGTIPMLYTVDVFSYAGNTNKTALLTASQDMNTSGFVTRSVGLYRSTSAITRIDLLRGYGSADLSAGSTATLYGILKA